MLTIVIVCLTAAADDNDDDQHHVGDSIWTYETKKICIEIWPIYSSTNLIMSNENEFIVLKWILLVALVDSFHEIYMWFLWICWNKMKNIVQCISYFHTHIFDK